MISYAYIRQVRMVGVWSFLTTQRMAGEVDVLGVGVGVGVEVET